jgi:hypothetical protein
MVRKATPGSSSIVRQVLKTSAHESQYLDQVAGTCSLLRAQESARGKRVMPAWKNMLVPSRTHEDENSYRMWGGGRGTCRREESEGRIFR